MNRQMLKSDPFEITLGNPSRVFINSAHISEFINHKRVKVVASFEDKTIAFYAALQPFKNEGYTIMFSKAKQKQLGVFMNDYFTLQLFEDTSKYGVEMSSELEAVLLSDHDAFTIFENLTPGRQRSIIYTIARYKSPQMRIDKSILLTENLKRGITDSKLWLQKN